LICVNDKVGTARCAIDLGYSLTLKNAANAVGLLYTGASLQARLFAEQTSGIFAIPTGVSTSLGELQNCNESSVSCYFVLNAAQFS
jgi:hypothetical protein